MKREGGFTLIELLITMVIFVLAIAAASAVFSPLLAQFKQQSKVSETQIQGMIGLEMLRRDIEHAGFGLPWVIPATITPNSYKEAAGGTTPPIPSPDIYNDTSPNALGPPRAILSGNGAVKYGGDPDGSDYLVIKATNIATNVTAPKWAYVIGTGAAKCRVKSWGIDTEDLSANDRAIVLIPSRGENNQRILVNNGDNFSVRFNPAAFPLEFSPPTENDLFLIYGIDPDTDLRMPFGRADYYIRRVGGTTIPSRCASGTGVLVKSVIAHVDGERGPGLPLMDCVADFQVVFGRDTNEDGDVDINTDTLAGLTAQEIRNQVKEVRVYILAHEGQKDPSYTYPNNAINTDPDSGLGRIFDFAANGITDWQNYRWKLYTLVVNPKNLR